MLSLAQNTLLTRTEAVSRSGWVQPSQVQRLAEHLINRLQVKAGGPAAAAQSLSGGELLALRDAGCALRVVSEGLDDLFQISDRLVVMARGRVSPALATTQATVAQIDEWMSGLWDQKPAHASA
jgi:general nucleoside transport system ATP-binding protein